MIEQLQKMVSARDNGDEPPTLLNMSNLVAIFGLIDVTQRGRYLSETYITNWFKAKHLPYIFNECCYFSISSSEALSALKKVGIENDIFGMDPVPREVFIRKSQQALHDLGANFKANM